MNSKRILISIVCFFLFVSFSRFTQVQADDSDFCTITSVEQSTTSVEKGTPVNFTMNIQCPDNVKPTEVYWTVNSIIASNINFQQTNWSWDTTNAATGLNHIEAKVVSSNDPDRRHVDHMEAQGVTVSPKTVQAQPVQQTPVPTLAPTATPFPVTNVPNPVQTQVSAEAVGNGQAENAKQTYGQNDCPVGTTIVPVLAGQQMAFGPNQKELRLRALPKASADSKVIVLMTTSTTQSIVVLSIPNEPNSQSYKCSYGSVWVFVRANYGSTSYVGWAAYQGENAYSFLVPVTASMTPTATPQPTLATVMPVIAGLTKDQLKVGTTVVQLKVDSTIYADHSESAPIIATAPAGAIFIMQGYYESWVELGGKEQKWWTKGANIQMFVYSGVIPTPVPVVTLTPIPTTTGVPTGTPPAVFATPTSEGVASKQFSCEGVPTPQLVQGFLGHNSPSEGTTSVRLLPRSTTVLYSLQPGEYFLVLSDQEPQCLNSDSDIKLFWWHIRVTTKDGQIIEGWVPEASGKTGARWLLPN